MRKPISEQWANLSEEERQRYEEARFNWRWNQMTPEQQAEKAAEIDKLYNDFKAFEARVLKEDADMAKAGMFCFALFALGVIGFFVWRAFQ